ncbi:intein C-terminal splicing domain protein [Leptospira weilii serovar Ranarum str. ICFT]|uniref:Intein C-terminal splicing domain protein n=1 Tax=Leptospira weilii serovar Ranarum str. ICFT TaxID=1218598 RepID=N1WTQ3_9LEPT|nr:polymorphic toxin-type HINT domain-containing protein [Leptospira weilii]EMY79243.1 intein C-terminal splicing domain protein [Leptospira weilii serovar Ranarum str. ICFT]
MKTPLDIAKLEKQQARDEARGRLSPSSLTPNAYSLTPRSAYNEYLDAVKSGESVSCLNKSAEQCAKSAMNSGFLVGEVPEGTFGEQQFVQSYSILKTKKEMDKRKGKMDAARKRKSGGMGRFYNQLGVVAEGAVEAGKGVGNMILSQAQAILKASMGNFSGAKKDMKEAGRQGERAVQGALYAVTGMVDFVMFAVETVAEPFVALATLGLGNQAMNGVFAEGNYELAKFRESNKAQRHINELGMRTGAEMYANDAALDKVVTTTLAAAGIIGGVLSFTPFAPIGVALMSISALGTMGWKTFRGAYEGGAAGMAAGFVSGAINSYLEENTGGMLSVNLSYSYANGFGAGVSVGTPNKMKVGGSIGLNYNSKSGAWGASVGLKVGFGAQSNKGFTNSAELSYNRNNIGRDNQSSGVSANVRGKYNEKGDLYGSIGLSYDTKAGYGATVGVSSKFGPMSVTPSWTVSEYGGLSSDVQYGFDRNLFDKTNNPEHAAANRNLFDDILNGVGAAVGGFSRENLSNGWNAIKNGLFGGGEGATANNGGNRTTARGLDAISLYNAAMDEVACFVKGTKILTQDNTKTIENIEVGDIVFAFNEVTLELGYKKVLEVFRNKTDILIKISLEDNTIIETTEGHPFYIKEKGFVLAKDLTKKDRVVNSNLKEITIKEINRVEVDGIDTYNFHVEDFHTYFVSNSNILVHNTSVPENPIEIMKQKLNNYYDKLSRGVKLTKQESDQLDRLEGAMGAGVYARHQNEKGEWVWTQIGEMKTRSTSDEITNGGVDGRPNVRVLKDGDKIQTQYGELTVRVLDSKNAPITWTDPKTGNAIIDGLGHRQFIYGPNGEEYSYKEAMNGTEAVRASAEYAATKPNLWNRLFNFGKSENNTGSLPSSTGTRAW